MIVYKYSFETEKEIKSCEDCLLLDEIGNCSLLSNSYPGGYKQQFKSCPLKKEALNELPDVPFVSYAPDELKEELGTDFWCQKCGKMHEIKCGKVVKVDGTKEDSRALQYVQCDDGKLYVAGLYGKAVKFGGAKSMTHG
jgi:hypothetical protein